MSQTCNTCYQPISNCCCDKNCVDADGCLFKLDTKCIIYHKDNNELSKLTALDLGNGSTLTLILEALDNKVAQVAVLNTSLPNLRETYVINNLQAFLTSVDTEIGLLRARLDALEE